MARYTQMTNLSHCVLVIVALAIATLALAEPNVDEDLAAAEAYQAAASELNADILAPQSYENGTDKLDQTRRDLQAGQNPERVSDQLTQAEGYFEKAIAAANTARSIFAEALTQRQAAEIAKASELASALWAKGEKELANAASALEKDREAAALDGAARATAVYSEAELAAIKAIVVGEARSSILNATRLRADRYAPLTMNQAPRFAAGGRTEAGR